MSPTTSSSSSKYHRPGYLRALEAYEGVKAVYKYGRGFIVVRSVAPLVERVAEGALSRLPVIRTLKQQQEQVEEAAKSQLKVAAPTGAAAVISYPTLQGIDAKLATMLAGLDDYVDASLGDARTIQGKVLRTATHFVYAVADWTPLVGRQIKQLMIEIDPEHMSLAPRLTDRPALDVGESGEDAELMRGSFDKEVDDVSVVTDASEDVGAAGNGKNGDGKKKKDKRKDKRFLQNMGKGIKKVMNYPRTPVHDIVPSTGNIGAEEESSVVSGMPTPSGSGSGGNASIASTDAVASMSGSSSTASTPLRNSARKFFAAAAPGSGGNSKGKAAAAAEKDPSSA